MGNEVAAFLKQISPPGEIDDVAVRTLSPIADTRGMLCEIHRDEWNLAPRPVQWDFVTTQPRSLRGVHVHRRRYDYMIVLTGEATIGLTDIRRDVPSFRRSMTIAVSGGAPCLVVIPPGVAHGIYAHGPMSYLYGLTNPWDGDDDLGCRYDDRALGIAWPDFAAVILERDASLPTLDVLIRQFENAGGVCDDDVATSLCLAPQS